MTYTTTDRTVGTPGVHTYPYTENPERCCECDAGTCVQVVEKKFWWKHEHILHGQRTLH